MAELPLKGIRVLTIEVMWAVAMATAILGDLGAEVIRVENIFRFSPGTTSRGGWPKQTKEQNAVVQPQMGAYPNRDPGDKPFNMTPWFVNMLRNKRSMTLDIRRPEGWAIFEKLVKISDVVMENNATDTTEKLGLTYERLSKINPSIIVVNVPAYGCTGPYANRRAWGAHIEALIGHSLLRTYRDMDASYNGTVYASNFAGGALAAFAVMAALRYRKRTGKGQQIEVAQAEGALLGFGEAVMDYSMNKGVAVSVGNRDIHGAAPYGTYRCYGEDRWLNISVTDDDEWHGLCEAMGNPEWTKDEKFADTLSRFMNQEELDRRVEEWTIQHDHYVLMHILQRYGVPAGPVMDARDFHHDPHYSDRNWFNVAEHPQVGLRRWQGFFAKFSKTPLKYWSPPCMLGQDNEYVYKNLLKLTSEEYDSLRRKAHISDTYLDKMEGEE